MFKFGTLVVLKKNGNDGSKFPLVTSACILGSDSTCDIRINRLDVAREHCRLDANKNGQVRITHIGRSNQTLLNEKSLKSPVLIRHNDVITIADRKFRWESGQVLNEGASGSRTSLDVANQVSRGERRSLSKFNDSSSISKDFYLNQNSSVLRSRTPVGIVTPTRRISTDAEQSLASRRSIESLSKSRMSLTLIQSASVSRTERRSRLSSVPGLIGSPIVTPSSGKDRRSKSNEETKKTRKSVVRDTSNAPAGGTKSDDENKQVKANPKRRSRSKAKKVIKMRKLEDENAVKILAPCSPDNKKSAALRTIHGFNMVGKLKGKNKKYLVAKNLWKRKKYMVQRSERIKQAAIRLNELGPISRNKLVTLSQPRNKGKAKAENGQSTPMNGSRTPEADNTTTVKCTTRLRSSSSRKSLMTRKLSVNPSDSLTEIFVSPLQTPADKSISLPMQRMINSLSKRRSRSSLQPVAEPVGSDAEASPNLCNLGSLFKTPSSSKFSKLTPVYSAKALGASPALKSLRSSTSSSSPRAPETILPTKSPKTAPTPKSSKKSSSPTSPKKASSPASPKKVSPLKSSLNSSGKASGNSPVVRSLRSSGSLSSPTLLTKSPENAQSPKSPEKGSSPRNPKKVSPNRSFKLVLHKKSPIKSPKATPLSNTPVTLRRSTSTSSKSKTASPKSPPKESPVAYSLRNTPSPSKAIQSTKVKGKFPKKSPKSDFTDVDGVAELFENGESSNKANTKESPNSKLRSSTSGLRNLKLKVGNRKASPQADYTNVKGLRNLFKSPLPAKRSTTKVRGLNITPDLRSLFKSPRKSPRADYSNVDGLSSLFPSPKLVPSAKRKKIPQTKTSDVVKTPDVSQGRQLRTTQQSPNYSGIATLFETSPQPLSSKRSHKTPTSPRVTASRLPSRSPVTKKSPSPPKTPQVASSELATARSTPRSSASKKSHSPQTSISPLLAAKRSYSRSSASKKSPSPSKTPVSPRVATNSSSPQFSASKKSPSKTPVSPRVATNRSTPQSSSAKKSLSPPKTPLPAASPLATDRKSPRRLRSRAATPVQYTPLPRARRKRVVQDNRSPEIVKGAVPTITPTKQGSPTKQPLPNSPKKTPTSVASAEQPPKQDLYFPGGLKVLWKSPILKSPTPVQPIASPIKSPSKVTVTESPKKRGKAAPSKRKGSPSETLKKSKRRVAPVDDAKPEETPKRGRRGAKLQNDETKSEASPVKEVRSRRGVSSPTDNAELHVSPEPEKVKRGRRAVKPQKEDIEAPSVPEPRARAKRNVKSQKDEAEPESSPAKETGKRGQKRTNKQKDEAPIEASPAEEKVKKNTRQTKPQKAEAEPEASPVKRSRRKTNSLNDEPEPEASPVKRGRRVTKSVMDEPEPSPVKRSRRGTNSLKDEPEASPVKEVKRARRGTILPITESPVNSKRQKRSKKEPELSPIIEEGPISRRKRVESETSPNRAAETPSTRAKKSKKSPSKGKTAGVRSSARNKK